MIRGLAAAVATLPYRLVLGRIGRRARVFPPLIVSGGRRIYVGDDLRTEGFACLSAAAGGRIEIGAHCELGAFSRLEADTGHIRLGDRTSVNQFCLLNGYGGLDIGSGVRIASHCVILTSTHEFGDVTRSIESQGVAGRPTAIGDDVWLGAHVVVSGGVTIGSHSIVGAGAVVLSDVPSCAVVAGVPARVIRMRVE